MAIFVYVCDVCGKEHEKLIRTPLYPSCFVCEEPGCGGKAVKREINQINFQFAGRGYKTEAFQKVGE